MLRPRGLYRFRATRGGVVLQLEERPSVAAAETPLLTSVSLQSSRQRSRECKIPDRGGWCSVYPAMARFCLSVLALERCRLVSEAGAACRCD